MPRLNQEKLSTKQRQFHGVFYKNNIYSTLNANVSRAEYLLLIFHHKNCPKMIYYIFNKIYRTWSEILRIVSLIK